MENMTKVILKNERGFLQAVLWETDTLKVEESYSKVDDRLVSVDLKINGEYAGSIPCLNGSIKRKYMIYDNGELKEKEAI